MTDSEMGNSAMSRILVIDDEEGIRRLLRDTLEDAGYEVVEAEDGEEGLRLFSAEPADLVITDILMPKRSGIETISDLRSKHPGVKIIAVSGGGRTENLEFLEIAGKVGADRTIAKPFDLDEVVSTVRGLLDQGS